MEKLNLLGVSAFCESLGMMMRSGIQVSEAVSLLGQSKAEKGILEENIEKMEKDLENGSSLTQAMKHTEIFPDYVLRMVETGESTGKIEDVLFTLADYYRQQNSISEKLKAALVYPLAMLGMIIVVLIVMLKMVLPSFSSVYTTLTGSLSSSSYSYISYAYLFCRIALVIMIAIVVLVLVGYLLWKGKGKNKVEALLARNSTCRTILENLALYRFTSAFEVFLASGEMQDNALEKAKEMCQYPPVEERLKQCEEKMQEGLGFASAANEVELYEPIYGRTLIPSERSGNMDEALRRLIALLSQNAANHIELLINTLEPLLSGILMITIGIALLSVMLPLIGIMNSIG